MLLFFPISSSNKQARAIPLSGALRHFFIFSFCAMSTTFFVRERSLPRDDFILLRGASGSTRMNFYFYLPHRFLGLLFTFTNSEIYGNRSSLVSLTCMQYISSLAVHKIICGRVCAPFYCAH